MLKAGGGERGGGRGGGGGGGGCRGVGFVLLTTAKILEVGFWKKIL